MRFTLGKDEKLRLKTLVDGTFASGKTLYEYPLRLTYRVLSREELEGSFRNGTPEGIGPLQMLITVPKKTLRHAVDRVRMRRLIREAYRLNRLELKAAASDSDGVRTVSMAFIYLHPEKLDYSSIEKKMKKLLGKLQESLTAKPDCQEDKMIGDEAGGRKQGNDNENQ